MKTLSLFFCLLVGSTFTFGQGIKFESANLASVLAKAKQEGKNVFVDCSTVWCKPCKWMEANVFSLPSVGQYYNDHFISMHIDMEKGEGIELRKKFQVNAFPTYLYLDTAGNLIHRDGGAKEPEAFLGIGKKALNPANNLEGMNQQYESGNRSRGFLREYIVALGRAHEKAQQDKVFDSYYTSLTSSDLFNEKDFDVIMSVVNMGDKPFLFVLQNHEKFKDVVGEKKLDSRLYAKFILPFSQMVYKNQVEAMKNEAEKFKAYYPAVVQKAEDMAMVRYYREQKLALPLTKACVAFVQNYTPDSPDDIFYCMNMVVNAPDMEKEAYIDALHLSENAIEKFPSNYNLRDVYACLLFKSGKKDEAFKEAKKAMASAPANKKDKLLSKKFFERYDN